MTKWKSVPFHTLFHRLQKCTGFPDEELLSVYRDYGVIRKSDRDDNFNRPGDLSDYQLVERGDLVLNKMKTWQGSLGISSHRGIVSPAYFVYKPVSQNDQRFLHYALRCRDAIDYYASHSTGIRVNQWDLSPEWLDVMRVPLPDLEIQRRIADYLDKEISEMDALIENLEALLRELETRKTPLQDSKINHQGASIPTVPAKLLARIKTGEGDTQDAIEDGEFPFYVRSDTVRASDKWTFEGPAVLTSGDGAGVGKIFHYVEGKSRAHQRVYVLKDFKNVDPKYFYWCFQTNFPRQVEHGGAKATVESVRMNMVADTPIPLPPLEKQREIADELDREFEKMNRLIESSTRLVSLLKERKTALITEVVTGRKEV